MENICGNQLKAIRTKLDQSQEEFADNLGVKRTTYAKWELAKSKELPKSSQLILLEYFQKLKKEEGNTKLASILGVAGLGALLGGPFGALLGAGITGLIAQDASKEKCPWCEKPLHSLESVESASLFLCNECSNPFKFIPGVGAIKIAT